MDRRLDRPAGLCVGDAAADPDPPLQLDVEPDRPEAGPGRGLQVVRDEVGLVERRIDVQPVSGPLGRPTVDSGPRRPKWPR